jgi:hypothetical protein
MTSPTTAVMNRRTLVARNKQPGIEDERGRGGALADEQASGTALRRAVAPWHVDLRDDGQEQNGRGGPADQVGSLSNKPQCDPMTKNGFSRSGVTPVLLMQDQARRQMSRREVPLLELDNHSFRRFAGSRK